MKTKTLKPGYIITDNYDRICLVIRPVERPGQYWIEGQDDPKVRKVSRTDPWFEAFPLTGGAVNVPASLCTVLRKATDADLMAALRGGNSFARETICSLFL
mgnify:FL=1